MPPAESPTVPDGDADSPVIQPAAGPRDPDGSAAPHPVVPQPRPTGPSHGHLRHRRLRPVHHHGRHHLLRRPAELPQRTPERRPAPGLRQRLAHHKRPPVIGTGLGTQVDQLIGSADTLPGSLSVLHAGGTVVRHRPSRWARAPSRPSCGPWSSTAPRPPSSSSSADSPQIVIGVPLPAEHAAYFEVFSLDELASTLRTLAFALAAAALVTTLAGAALGRWASGRALRPLAGVTEAAVAIAGGQLDTRVEAGDDVDLQELASAFNRMTANLQERIEREARFTSDVSHELRSPLTTLVGHRRCARGPPRRAEPPGPERPRPPGRRPHRVSPGWWTTCWRSPGSTPAPPSSRSTRWTPASWYAGPSAPRPPSGRTATGRRWSSRSRSSPGWRGCASGWTSAGSSG